MSGYEAVKRIAREKPEWLPYIRACYDFATDQARGDLPGDHFAGRWIGWRAGAGAVAGTTGPAGVLRKVDSARGGHRAYYVMPDREGVRRALLELG